MSEITDRARKLRKNQTNAEKLLWLELRNKKLGIKFRRQYPIIFFEGKVRHCFIADFACLEKNLVIEIDGKIHESKKEYDLARNYIINQRGYRIIRFNNDQINLNIIEVLKNIKNAIDALPHEDGEGSGMGVKN